MRERKLAMRADVDRWSARTGQGREALAESLGVSLRILEGWLALASDREMPPRYEEAWCLVTGSMAILDVGAGRLGGRFVNNADLRLLKFAELDITIRQFQHARDAMLPELMHDQQRRAA